MVDKVGDHSVQLAELQCLNNREVVVDGVGALSHPNMVEGVVDITKVVVQDASHVEEWHPSTLVLLTKNTKVVAVLLSPVVAWCPSLFIKATRAKLGLPSLVAAAWHLSSLAASMSIGGVLVLNQEVECLHNNMVVDEGVEGKWQVDVGPAFLVVQPGRQLPSCTKQRLHIRPLSHLQQ